MKTSTQFQAPQPWARPVLRDVGTEWVKFINPPAGGDPCPEVPYKVVRVWTDPRDGQYIAKGREGGRQRVRAHERTVWLTTRLTSKAWDGDARSTTAKTKIDMSTVFSGYPDAAVRAVYVHASVRDSGSANHDCLLILGPDDTANIGIGWRCSGQSNDYLHSAGAWVPCDVNGDIYYQVVASGAGTLDAWLDVWGYML